MRQVLALLLLAGSLAFAQSYPGVNNSRPEGIGEPPNDPPVWNNTPTPIFVEDVVSSYSLVPTDVSDPESDTLTIADEAGCILPTGVTVDDANDEIDYAGTGTAGTTTDCVFSADEASNDPVNSPVFSIVINAASATPTGWQDYNGTSRSGVPGAIASQT